MLKLHLGSGGHNFKEWTNIDANPRSRPNIVLDVRTKFPFEDMSVDFIFNEHLIEHLGYEEGLVFLKECHRVLKSDGVLRISTPDLAWIIEKYLEGKLDEWVDSHFSPTSCCQLMNQWMRRWHHKFLYDKAELYKSLGDTGFSTIEDRGYRESSHHELTMLEHRPYHHELIVEAKP